MNSTIYRRKTVTQSSTMHRTIKNAEYTTEKTVHYIDSSYDSKEEFRFNLTLHFCILLLLELNVVEFCFKSLARWYWMFRYYCHALRFSTRRWILGIILLSSLSKFRFSRDAMCWRPYGWRIISSEVLVILLSKLSPTFRRHICMVH
jgi:hypothetical protein